MTSHIDISVTLPTRGRPIELRDSVGMLMSHALHPERVQVLYGIDGDDGESLDAANLMARSGVDWISDFPERHGYANLHLYLNELATHAAGDWLMLWNDDSFMRSQGWDTIVRGYDDQDVILDPQTDHGNEMLLFPIIPVRYVDLVGHVSLSNHCDSWWDDISVRLGIRTPVPIVVNHMWAGVKQDATAAESRVGYRSAEFFGPEMTDLRAADAERIRSILR